MNNKKVILGISALLLGASLFTTGCGKTVKISSKAVVGFENAEITANDFYKEIKKDNISVLVDMMDHKILDEKYPKTDEEDKDVKEQIDNIRNYYGNEEQFKQVIRQYFGAENEEELEKILRLEYKRTKAVEEYVEGKVSKSEINKYYNEKIYGDMGAKHILITVEATEESDDEEKNEAEENALNKAKEVIEKLNNGEKFEDLAKEYSQDKSSAAKGGDLSTFKYDDMVTEFSEACKNLNVNEYTKEPVKTSYGYHIILKTKQEDKPALKKVKSEIKEKIREQKLNDDKTLYYETLMNIREENGITWNDSSLKKAYKNLMNDLIEQAKK